jgi:hypothetical protein
VGRTYRAVNTFRLGYKNQSVNAVLWNTRCLFSDPHKTHKYTRVGRTYRAVNTLRLGYKNQSVNAVQWNNRCLFSGPHKIHKYTVRAEHRRIWMLNPAVHKVSTGLWRIHNHVSFLYLCFYYKPFKVVGGLCKSQFMKPHLTARSVWQWLLTSCA